MKLAFMSSVCPKLSLPRLIEKANEHGYQGIELRPEWDHAHGVELDADAGVREGARKLAADSGVELCCISPGVKFCREEPGDRDKNLDLLSRYVVLAAEVGIPRIRLFGDPLPNSGGGKRQANYRVQADYLARGAEHAAEAGVKLCLETHSNFRAFDAGEVLFQAGYPAALFVNWHLGHCLRHGEDIDEAYRHVKGRVAHVHFSLGEEAVNRPHIERQAALLAAEGYDEYFSVEVINPPESEGALSEHAQAWKEMAKNLGP